MSESEQEAQQVIDQVVGELERGDWAPDNAAPAAVKLIADEQYLQDLGLRDLASADSAEFHQAIRALQMQLGSAFAQGQRHQRHRHVFGLLGLGWLLGALSGAALLALFGP